VRGRNVSSDHRRAVTHDQLSSSAVSEAPLRVLIVDDDVDAVEGTAALFAELGAEVARAHTGRTGLECALTSAPDVIVLDLEMPDVNGYVLARLLDSTPMPKRPLVVAVSEPGPPYA